VIEYRTFRNTDPPLVAEAWMTCLAGPRTVSIPVKSTTLLEYFVLAKPYFDAAGLVLAIEDAQPVGFAHAGFVSNVEGNGLDTSTGVLCALGVAPRHRRHGVGSELLRRSEDYLRGQGAKRLLAGAMTPDNPFLFGLYGGCDSAGFLASHEAAAPFLMKHGYTPARQCGIFQRSLGALQAPADNRFADIRLQYDIVGAPLPADTWWRESVLGPIEVFEYDLRDKKSEEIVASLLLWDMELFGQTWKQSCVGLLDLQVEPSVRRRGLGRYLLSQVLRHLRDQTFGLFEARIDLDNAPGIAFFESLGFVRVETGTTYQRDVS
jgi:GNAT superfamily N-acetyltransferase